MKYKDFRCPDCKQLQFKYRLVEGNKLVIEIKCYNCNTFSYFTVNLNQLKHESDKQK